VLGAQVCEASPSALDNLIKSVTPLNDRVRLVVLDGAGDRETLQKRAKAAGLTDIFVPESLPAPQAYLGALDIFTLLAPADACPLALTEAMATGLPVVATDVGDVAAMLGTGSRAFLVREGDAAALASVLARLAEDAGQRKKLGDANRKRALQCFDETIMFDLYARLYGGAVEREDALL
jgi:glycosyltransferase involved in cell wall biosynthesis